MKRQTLIFFTLSLITIASSHQFTFPSLPFNLLPTDLKISQTPELKWTGADFSFPDSSTKALLKSSSKYIPKSNIATRGQIYRDTVFFAQPRYRQGIPATLVKTKLKRGSCSVILEPFPCWSMQEEGKCSALQSVVDIVIDGQDILWALDTGVVNTLEEEPLQHCPPKVLAFNVKTNKLVKTVSFDGLISKSSRLQYLTVDYGSDGRPFIYVSDAASRAIIVYDVQANRGYRVMLPRAVSEGCGKKDVLYLALTRVSTGSSTLYFTYLCSKKLFAIKTEYLRDGRTNGKIEDVGTKSEKMVIIGTDNGSAIFFRNEGHSEVFRWDTNLPFQQTNFKPVYKSDSCQLATHAVADYKHSRMRVLESNFPDYIQGKVGCGAIQQLTVMEGCY